MYEGAKLFIFSILCLIPILKSYLKKETSLLMKSLMWIPLFLMFMWLAIDELAQFHENTKPFLEDISPYWAERFSGSLHKRGYNSTEWVIFYIPLFLGFLAYLLYAARYMLKKYTFKTFIPALTGIGCYISVIALEVFGMTRFDAQDYSSIYLWEESLEMIGTSLMGISLLLIATAEFSTLKGTELKNIPPIKLTTLQILSISTVLLILFATLTGRTVQRLSDIQQQNTQGQDQNIATTVERQPSREPQQGCMWENETRTEISLRYYKEACPNSDTNTLTRQNALYILPDYISSSSRITEYKAVEVLPSPVDQIVQDSIWVRFIEPLSEEQRLACKVVKIEESSNDRKEIYRIFPDLTLIRESHLAEYIDCGAYSATQTDGYFEYHPYESSQKYLFITPPSVSPNIDYDTVEIIP